MELKLEATITEAEIKEAIKTFMRNKTPDLEVTDIIFDIRTLEEHHSRLLGARVRLRQTSRIVYQR